MKNLSEVDLRPTFKKIDEEGIYTPGKNLSLSREILSQNNIVIKQYSCKLLLKHILNHVN